MLANIIIMVLILGYCAFVIYKSVKNSKEGKHMGCAGCSGNCGSCGGCRVEVLLLRELHSLLTRRSI